MATFRVGQQVRVIVATPEYLGKEGCISQILYNTSYIRSEMDVRIEPVVYELDFVKPIKLFRYTVIVSFLPYMLAPLEDPKADAFVALVKSWKVYTEPVVTKECA